MSEAIQWQRNGITIVNDDGKMTCVDNDCTCQCEEFYYQRQLYIGSVPQEILDDHPTEEDYSYPTFQDLLDSIDDLSLKSLIGIDEIYGYADGGTYTDITEFRQDLPNLEFDTAYYIDDYNEYYQLLVKPDIYYEQMSDLLGLALSPDTKMYITDMLRFVQRDIYNIYADEASLIADKNNQTIGKTYGVIDANHILAYTYLSDDESGTPVYNEGGNVLLYYGVDVYELIEQAYHFKVLVANDTYTEDITTLEGKYSFLFVGEDVDNTIIDGEIRGHDHAGFKNISFISTDADYFDGVFCKCKFDIDVSANVRDASPEYIYLYHTTLCSGEIIAAQGDPDNAINTGQGIHLGQGVECDFVFTAGFGGDSTDYTNDNDGNGGTGGDIRILSYTGGSLTATTGSGGDGAPSPYSGCDGGGAGAIVGTQYDGDNNGDIIYQLGDTGNGSDGGNSTNSFVSSGGDGGGRYDDINDVQVNIYNYSSQTIKIYAGKAGTGGMYGTTTGAYYDGGRPGDGGVSFCGMSLYCYHEDAKFDINATETYANGHNGGNGIEGIDSYGNFYGDGGNGGDGCGIAQQESAIEVYIGAGDVSTERITYTFATCGNGGDGADGTNSSTTSINKGGSGGNSGDGGYTPPIYIQGEGQSIYDGIIIAGYFATCGTPGNGGNGYQSGDGGSGGNAGLSGTPVKGGSGGTMGTCIDDSKGHAGNGGQGSSSAIFDYDEYPYIPSGNGGDGGNAGATVAMQNGGNGGNGGYGYVGGNGANGSNGGSAVLPSGYAGAIMGGVGGDGGRGGWGIFTGGNGGHGGNGGNGASTSSSYTYKGAYGGRGGNGGELVYNWNFTFSVLKNGNGGNGGNGSNGTDQGGSGGNGGDGGDRCDSRVASAIIYMGDGGDGGDGGSGTPVGSGGTGGSGGICGACTASCVDGSDGADGADG